MKWASNIIHRFIKWLISLFFRQNHKYGVSFDVDINLSNLMSPLPNVNTFYDLARDVGIFEVVDVNAKESIVVIREVGTDTEYKIDSELFIILFVSKSDASSNFDLLKYK